MTFSELCKDILDNRFDGFVFEATTPEAKAQIDAYFQQNPLTLETMESYVAGHELEDAFRRGVQGEELMDAAFESLTLIPAGVLPDGLFDKVKTIGVRWKETVD